MTAKQVAEVGRVVAALVVQIQKASMQVRVFEVPEPLDPEVRERVLLNLRGLYLDADWKLELAPALAPDGPRVVRLTRRH